MNEKTIIALYCMADDFINMVMNYRLDRLFQERSRIETVWYGSITRLYSLIAYLINGLKLNL